MVEGVDSFVEGPLVAVDDQAQAQLTHHAVAECVHLAKLPGRVHVQQGNRHGRGMERLPRQVQQHLRVLADAVEEDGPREFRHHFADHVDAVCLQFP